MKNLWYISENLRFMKTSKKALSDVRGLSDLKINTGTARKSGMPDLPTTAILGLSRRRNERDRIVKELKKTGKRKVQMEIRLKDVEKEMNILLTKATQAAVEIRGTVAEGGSGGPDVDKKKKGKLVLEY